MNHSETVNFIWNIANLIRDTFRRSKYPDVILPFTVLRRIDCVLAPTKQDVLDAYQRYKNQIAPEALDKQLRRAAGYAFYNTSLYDFQRLHQDHDNLAENLRAYINGFSPNMRQVIERFDFDNTIAKLDESDLLFLVLQEFNSVDLHPDQVDNEAMGDVFQELIRRFNEASNENPGEHFTPPDVVSLMTNLILAGDRDFIGEPHVAVTVYDPCCGTGGMLTRAKERISAHNEQARVYLFGQEVNPETWAICKSDLFMLSEDGRDAENIALGSTLSNDLHADHNFNYLLANPPYGKDWRMDKEAVEREAQRPGSRFSPGTPRSSDGQMLFLLHMIARMHPKRSNGQGEHSRMAIIMNGSPLFTGDAGSGESEIRRFVLENDFLEAIIALPENLFYNTGIGTYIWVLSNDKAPERRGKVQLVDATACWVERRKSLGDKRRDISEEQITLITDLFTAFEENEQSKIFDAADFGFRKIRVERPLRLNFKATAERIARLQEERAFANLAKSRKRDKEKRQADIAAGRQKQQAILDMLQDIPPTLFTDIRDFRPFLKKAAKKRDIKLYAAMRDAIYSALGQKDEDAAVVVDRQGRPQPDSDLRDYENVPLKEDVQTFLEREVLPYVSDAWIDEEYSDEQDQQIGRVGYEINFNRYFYEYTPPRPLEEIEADIREVEERIVRMLREVTG